MIRFYILYVILCFIAAICGRRTRAGFWGIFFSSVIFTPVLALLFLLLCTGGGKPKQAPDTTRP